MYSAPTGPYQENNSAFANQLNHGETGGCSTPVVKILVPEVKKDFIKELSSMASKPTLRSSMRSTTQITRNTVSFASNKKTAEPQLSQRKVPPPASLIQPSAA